MMQIRIRHWEDTTQKTRSSAVKVFGICVAIFCTTSLALGLSDTEVCVIVDQGQTAPSEEHPNMAVDAEDFSNTFFIYHKQSACFDLAKQYYLMDFISENSANTIYGTTCFYVPSPSDEGKVVVMEGFNGGSLCPVS